MEDGMPSGAQGPGLYAPRDAKIPPQVEVAFDIVRWANGIEAGQQGASYDSRTEGRKLVCREIAVYESGLEVLRLYLTGEMSFAGAGELIDDLPNPEPQVDVTAGHRFHPPYNGHP